MKRKLSVLLILAMTLSLCGCTRYPTKCALKKEANVIMAGEDCSQIDYDKQSGGIVVTYKSNERDLEFHVYGERTKNIWELTTADGFDVLTDPSISSDYVQQVHDIYIDDVTSILEDYTYEQTIDKYRCNYKIAFDDPADVPELVELLVRANDIYSEELDYHSEDWVKENYLALVVINYCSDNVSDSYHYAFIYIDGVSTAEDYEAELYRVINHVDNGE